MDQEYRYPLTRICLRNGALTLPRTMLGLFPDEGEVTAVDSLRDIEFALRATGPRTVTGLRGFFEAHDLDVNDELLIRPLEDGRYAFTPLPRARKRDYARPGAVAALLDELAEAELAASESEVRALYPDLPGDVDVRGLLEADERFVYFEGRWHVRAALERRIDEAEAERRGAAGKGRGQAASAATDAGSAIPTTPRGGAEGAADGQRPQSEPVTADLAALERSAEAPQGGRTRDDGAAGDGLLGGEARQEALWQSTWQEPWRGADPAPWPPPAERGAPDERHADAATPAPSRPVLTPAERGGGERDRAGGASGAGEPAPAADAAGPAAEPRAVDGRPPARADDATVKERRAPEPRAVFPGDAALMQEDEEDEPVDLRQVFQARELLQTFGFRVEALGQGQLMVHAELGRRGYTALVYALGFGQRLDWAALLARRREAGARYLAVFGDRRDLQRLQAPAELARATLWSWEGLHRARTLSQSVPVSPYDLELHFEREGLFGHGLERFERDVAALVAERGAFSEVLTHLAGMRAPTVFLLEDLAGRGTLSRDVVLKLLERLSEAPFHLVGRVGQGEFCLRLPVADGLTNLLDYASSLRDRLPSRSRERLTGLGEPEWLQAAEGEAPPEPGEGGREPAAESGPEGAAGGEKPGQG